MLTVSVSSLFKEGFSEDLTGQSQEHRCTSSSVRRQHDCGKLALAPRKDALMLTAEYNMSECVAKRGCGCTLQSMLSHLFSRLPRRG